MELRKTYRFEASHILPKHPGKCSRLHGHSWVLHVSVRGPVNSDTGFVMDYGDISKVVKPLVERLDHRHLGQWPILEEPVPEWEVEGLPPDFYPTSENLLWWIGDQLLRKQDSNDYGDRLEWSRIALEETCTAYAELTREEYDRCSTSKSE